MFRERSRFRAVFLAGLLFQAAVGCGKVPTWDELSGKSEPPPPPTQSIPNPSTGAVTSSGTAAAAPVVPVNSADVLNRFRGIHSMSMTDQDLEQLASVQSGLEGITEVNARGSAVSDAGLAHLQKLPALQKLSLDSTRVTDAGLASLQRVPSLSDLSLNSTGVTSVGLGHLATLPALRRLELMGCDLNQDDFAAVGKLPALEVLVLNRVHELHDAEFDLVCEARTLKVLELNDCTGLTDRGLASLAKLTALEELWLNKVNLSGSGLGAAAAKGGLKSLKLLSVSAVPINLSGARAINSLKTLETLDISYIMGMNDVVFVEFVEGMRNLKKLSIEGNRGILGGGFAKIKAASASLESINAQSSGVTDQGLPFLKGFKKLKFLDLGNTTVTLLGVQQFKKMLPECTVHYAGMNY